MIRRPHYSTLFPYPTLFRSEAEVWAVDGDGCFQMTNQELATCAVEGAPIKVAIINNGNLGMVRQWQTLFYEERYSQRSEEHTSELQSHVNLVCRLLLEKKKY